MGSSLSKRGAGDADREINHNLQLNDFEKLPILVKNTILKFLPESDVANLRCISKLTKDAIDFDYGVRVTIPSLAKGWKSHTGHNVPVTKSIQQSIMESLRNKVIRILEVVEVPPMYHPFPFDTYITQPILINEVILVYVNLQLVHEIVTKCKRMQSLTYKSKYKRDLVYETVGMLLQAPIILPKPPSGNEFVQIMQALPAPLSPLNRLTSLSLKLHYIKRSDVLNKDWANVMFLLVVLNAPNLSKFSFQQDCNIRQRGTCMMLICLSELLRKTPNLAIFNYTIKINYREIFPMLREINEREIFSLVERYGSAESKLVVEAYPHLERMETQLKDIMGTIGRFHQMREMSASIGQEIEANCFFEFAKKSSSLQSVEIHRQHLSEDTVLHQNQLLLELLIIPFAQEPHRLCSHLRRLHICHGCDCIECKLPMLSLINILRQYIALEYLVLNESAKPYREDYEYVQVDNVEVIPPEDEEVINPVIVRNIRTQEYRYNPDIRIFTTVPQETFPGIHTVILKEVNMLASDCHILARFTHLKKLEILIPPSFQHNHFGFNARDLLSLLNLRLLNDVLVGKIIFPLDNPGLANSLREALESVGNLLTNHENIDVEDPLDDDRDDQLRRYKPLFQI